MKYLGIDYGLKKIGLSFSEGTFASPLGVLKVNSLEEAVNKALGVVQKEGIDEIVIGVAESGENKNATLNFINKLSQKIFVRITKVDETLSSYHARVNMINTGVKKSVRREDDAYSAAEILQEYLDNLK